MRPAIELVIDDEASNNSYSITFTQRPDCEVWLKNQDGEGMGMKVQSLYKMIDDFFKENH